MKKMLTIAAIVLMAVISQAVQVGWNVATGSADYANNAYNVFVIGQKGVTSVAQITELLDAGKDVSSYVFGSGTLNSAGTGSVGATSASAGSITPASYPATITSFAVVFDSGTPTAGKSMYVAISGQANQTKTVSNANASTITLATGNVNSIVSNSSNWKSFGAVPEPTTVALLAIGLAAFGLKRKVA